MISNTNHDFQWGRSEVVIIYPDYMIKAYVNINMLDMINKKEDVNIIRQNLTWECDQQSQPCENLGSGFISPEIYQR